MIWWVESIKRVCRVLNYFEYILVFVSAVSGCVLIPAFPLSVDVPVGIVDSTVSVKICAITAGNKKYKWIIQKKKKMHDKKVLLVKTELNASEVSFLES